MHQSQTTAPQFFARSQTALCGMLQADRLTHHYSSIPTKDQILVPETLLKKRKSAEKEAADKAAQRETRKKVSPPTLFHLPYGDETYPQHLD